MNQLHLNDKSDSRSPIGATALLPGELRMDDLTRLAQSEREWLWQGNREQWLALFRSSLDLHARSCLDLVVIEPIALFFPCHAENHAAGMMEATAPLQRLTCRGLSVLLLHHPRKRQENVAGRSARG